MGMIIRAFARLLAMGSLCGAWILLLLCCLSVPTRNFNFSETHFGSSTSAAKLELGMFGHCYTNSAGVKTCSKPSFGYNLNVTALPQYAANTGNLVNITTKPLTSALVFYPLAVGSTSLANLLSLVPIRMVTIGCLGLVFLSIGAQAIALVIGLSVVLQANTALKLSFNPNTFVYPLIGKCVWFTFAALVVTVGSFLFLLVALEPAKSKNSGSNSNKPLNAVGAYGGSDYGGGGRRDNHLSSLYGEGYAEKADRFEHERAASISGRSRAAQAGRADRNIDGRRRRRPQPRDYDYEDEEQAVGRRSRASRRDYDEDEDDEEGTQVSRRRSVRSKKSNRSNRSRRDESEEEVSEEEEEPVRKPPRAAKRSGRRSRAAEEDEYDEGELDFAGRRVY